MVTHALLLFRARWLTYRQPHPHTSRVRRFVVPPSWVLHLADLTSWVPHILDPVFKGSTHRAPSFMGSHLTDISSRVPHIADLQEHPTSLLHGFHISWTYLHASGSCISRTYSHGFHISGTYLHGLHILWAYLHGLPSWFLHLVDEFYISWPNASWVSPLVTLHYVLFIIVLSLFYGNTILSFILSTSYSLYIYIPCIRQCQCSVLCHSVAVYLQQICTFSLRTCTCVSFYYVVTASVPDSSPKCNMIFSQFSHVCPSQFSEPWGTSCTSSELDVRSTLLQCSIIGPVLFDVYCWHAVTLAHKTVPHCLLSSPIKLSLTNFAISQC